MNNLRRIFSVFKPLNLVSTHAGASLNCSTSAMRVTSRRSLTMGLALMAFAALLAAPAACQVTYLVTVQTPAPYTGTTGFVEMQFNPGGIVTPATAQIINFNPDGGMIDGLVTTAPSSTAGAVTGQLPGTVTFSSTTLNTYNDYFQQFTYGTQFTFELVLSGPAITSPGGLSADNSFYLTLWDNLGNLILTNNTCSTCIPAVAEVDILGNGTVVTTPFPNAGGGPSVVTFSLPTAALDGPVQVRYAGNLGSGESYIDILNDGYNGDPLFGPGSGSGGNICVNVYAFDAKDEQLLSCCSCPVTPNGAVHLGVNEDLLAATSTGAKPTSATVKLISTLAGTGGTGTSCNGSAATVTAAGLVPGMAAWGTTLHSANGPGVFVTTQTPFVPVGAGTDDINSLDFRCGMIMGNGSNYGICGPCEAGTLGAAKM